MNVGLNVVQFDQRGSSTAMLDYALALKKHCGIDPILFGSKPRTTVSMDNFSGFRYHLYESPNELPHLVDREKLDFLYLLRAGANDDVTPTNCKTGVHCVFSMAQPHGSVYAGVSEWLAKHFQKELWVPHIIDLKRTDETLREVLRIPQTDFVVGRLGGYNQFDIPFVRNAVCRVLEERKDFWAIFLNTEPFVVHPRAKFIPFQLDLSYKSRFINTCDAMIHARSDGETFGLAVGEFSSFNKPVLTYDAPYDWYMRAHIHMLGEKAILYKNEEEVTACFRQIDKEYVKDVDWDCYSTRFSPENVIKQFYNVFIK
jgi:hypothetical protein